MAKYDIDTKTVATVVSMNNNYPFAMIVAGIVLIVASSIECDGGGDCNGTH